LLGRATYALDIIAKLDVDIGGKARSLVNKWNIGRDDAELVSWEDVPWCDISTCVRQERRSTTFYDKWTRIFRYMMFYDRSSPPLIRTDSERFRYTVPGLFEEWKSTGNCFFGTDHFLLTMHPTGDRADQGDDGALLVVMNRGGRGEVQKVFRLVDDMSDGNPLHISAGGIAVVFDWIYVSDDTEGMGGGGNPRGNRLFAFRVSDVNAGLIRGRAPENLAIGTIDVQIQQIKAVVVVDCVASGLFFRDGDDDKELLWVFEHHRPEDQGMPELGIKTKQARALAYEVNPVTGMLLQVGQGKGILLDW